MEENWSPIFTARIEKKNRIWVPKVIRELMEIEEGDVVEVKIKVYQKGKKILR